MQKKIIEGVEVQRSSGNVFADLGLPDAEKLKIKTGLVVEIRKAIRALGLTQQAAAKRMGVPQPKVSGMMRGDFTNLSERKLMDCLNRLGYDIEIKVRPASEPVGHLTLATAWAAARQAPEAPAFTSVSRRPVSSLALWRGLPHAVRASGVIPQDPDSWRQPPGL